MVDYLETKIAESKRVAAPRYGMARDGYTLRSGAPTSLMVRLDGETRWRRLMCWQFSNAGTCFVHIKGKCLVVREYDIPKERDLCPLCGEDRNHASQHGKHVC